MRTLCLYFQVHQPFRLRKYRFFDIGNEHYYYDDFTNKSIIRKIAEKCYLPANQTILNLIKKHGRKFRISYSISGVALEQFEMYVPEVIDSFKQLAATGCVEFLAETYAHSLVSLKNKDEFFEQVKLHCKKIELLFGQKPKVFRNTELIYSDTIGEMVAELGFQGMLTEGARHILGWKSPNFLYYNAINPKLKLLLRNFKFSDDIAFRFSNQSWCEWPVTAEKYVEWLNDTDENEQTVNLFMDYETFGEHQWASSGIFEFLKKLPEVVLKKSDFKFATPSEVIKKHQPVAPLHVHHPISWADEERDLTAWLGNDMQEDAFNKLYELQELVNNIKDPQLILDWHLLQVSDHFYYMCTKFFADGDVHRYFNPYSNPYDAFINYMNILSDFKERLIQEAELQKISLLNKDELTELIFNKEQELKSLKQKLIQKNTREDFFYEKNKKKTVATKSASKKTPKQKNVNNGE